ncbi:odorant receptor 94a-like [Cotesia typhae]|uniref:odorant receptor 94a-like n=1 Tax=Cotesia typhae TaxID=2053667 RepID=UPI003D69CF1A
MENIAIDIHRKFLNINVAILRYSGVWPLEPSAKAGWKMLNFIARILNFIFFITFLMAVAADVKENYDSLEIVGNDGCFFIGTSMAVMKACKFWNSYKKIIKLIHEIYDPIDTLIRSSDRGILINIKRSHFEESVAHYGFCVLCTLFAFCILFLIPREKGSLPFRTVYPFDVTKSPYYELIMVYQYYCLVYLLAVVLAMDITTIGFIRWSALQLIALTSNFKNCNVKLYKCTVIIKEPADTMKIFDQIDKLEITHNDWEVKQYLFFDFGERGFDDSFSRRFKICIKNHQRLVKTIFDLNGTLSFLILVQFGTSTCIICLNGYQLILKGGNQADLAKFLSYLVLSFAELFFWCWYGNQFTSVADTLTYNQWMSGWEEFAREHDLGDRNELTNLVTLSMIPAMKQLEFKAVGLFNLSMPTFLSVVKSSYSILLLLDQFTE